jgi:hypothetical protein
VQAVHGGTRLARGQEDVDAVVDQKSRPAVDAVGDRHDDAQQLGVARLLAADLHRRGAARDGLIDDAGDVAVADRREIRDQVGAQIDRVDRLQRSVEHRHPSARVNEIRFFGCVLSPPVGDTPCLLERA